MQRTFRGLILSAAAACLVMPAIAAPGAQAAEKPQEWELVNPAGIIEKAPIAQKALPYCSITYIDGQEMKDALSGYLGVLFDQDPASVGGAMPADDFYYMNE